MTPRMKLLLLAAVVAAVGGGVAWKMLHRHDLPSKRPAVVASDAPSRGSETQESASLKSTASSDADPNQSMAKTDDDAAKSVQAVRRPDTNSRLGGVIGGITGGGARNAGLFQARGIVVSHTEHSLVLGTENEGKLEFEVPDASDTAVRTASLGKGEFVVVGYTETNGRKVANTIRRVQIRSASPAEAARPKE